MRALGYLCLQCRRELLEQYEREVPLTVSHPDADGSIRERFEHAREREFSPAH